MKKKVKLFVVLLALPLIAVLGYYSVSPRATIINLSDKEFEEFVVSLPTSRISFSPIQAHSSNTIYFSPQNETGIGTYTLIAKNRETISGNFAYAEGGELGRVLRFTIESSGQVSVGE